MDFPPIKLGIIRRGASPLTAGKQWHNIGKTFLSPIDGKQPNDVGWMINSPLFSLPSLSLSSLPGTRRRTRGSRELLTSSTDSQSPEQAPSCSLRGSLFHEGVKHYLEMGVGVGSGGSLRGARFQRNGFMEMRVKGSSGRPLIGCLWSADTSPPPFSNLLHLPPVSQQGTMLYERGSPFTLITAVTWHAVGCPSVLNIYVSTGVLPWWLSRLWHVLSLSFAISLSLSLY